MTPQPFAATATVHPRHSAVSAFPDTAVDSHLESAARVSVLDLVERAAASDDPILQRAAASVRSRLSGLHLSRTREPAATGDASTGPAYVDLAPVVRDACTLLHHPVVLDCRDAPLMVRGSQDALRHAVATLLSSLEIGVPTGPIAVDISVITGIDSLGAQAAQVRLHAVAPGAQLGARALARLTAALALTLPGQPPARLAVAGDGLLAFAPGLEARCDPTGVSVSLSWPVDLG